MAAAGITRLPQRSPPIRLQQMLQVGRWMSKVAAGLKQKDESKTSANEKKKACCWIPDNRTGIYFPEGHEKVINDLPNGAASLTRTYWLRSEDGVDKPDPDFPKGHTVTYIGKYY
ncbi:uncharacterized protein LOC132051026 [Lycium ferocissimum]|uniref:uncharacterized protein LOC132051026 n=1 Tax=Lycium ferocissimum TaxID=112874 RepID=UPI002814DDD8|nr:uncharacterized protein LOC132051026 [Lycium ferocissimum]